MKREVGLWIDRRKAVIVMIAHDEEGMRRIQSSMEKHVCFFAGSSQDGFATDKRDRKMPNYLNTYYSEVIDWIRDAESIQIFGPGDAKLDLEKRLRHEQLGSRIVQVETIEKMTEGQIEARVWQHFLSQ